MPRRKTTEEFINDARKVHGNKYNYSLVDYIGSKLKVIIICTIHGKFMQAPNQHLSGNRCPYCYGNYRRTTDQFISKAKEIHGDKYDYSTTQYHTNVTNIEIKCHIHGIFLQLPSVHLNGSGCPTCVGKFRYDNESFISKANVIHNGKYDYSLIKYTNSVSRVIIRCSKHGEFNQRAYRHLQGQGCPSCVNISESVVHDYIKSILPDKEIIHDKPWEPMCPKRPDIRIPDMKLIIEYDGEYHFRNDRFSDGHFIEKRKVDLLKTHIALKEGYTTIRIPYKMNVRTKNEWKELLQKELYLRDEPTIVIIGDYMDTLYLEYLNMISNIVNGNIDPDWEDYYP